MGGESTLCNRPIEIWIFIDSRRRSEGRRPRQDSKQRKVMKGAASEFQLRMGLTHRVEGDIAFGGVEGGEVA